MIENADNFLTERKGKIGYFGRLSASKKFCQSKKFKLKFS